MKIENLQKRKGTEKNKKLAKAYHQMQNLIEALDKKGIPTNELLHINGRILTINNFNGSEKELIKTLKTTYGYVLNFIKRQLDFVPKHHFRALWLFYGSIAGAILLSIFNNYDVFVSLMLPLSVAAGIIIGNRMDNQAKIEGRQIELEATEI